MVRGVTPTSIKVGGLGDAQRYVGRRHRREGALRARERGGRRERAHVRLRRASATTRASASRTSRWATQLVEQDQVFAVVPTVTPDLGAVKTLTDQKVPYFGWAISLELLRQRLRLRVHRLPVPAGRADHEQRVGRAREDRRSAATPNPSAVLLTENTPSGKVVLDRLTAGVKSAGITVAAATSNLPVPAVGDYEGLATSVLRRERRQAARRGVRGRRLLQRRRDAAGAPRRAATPGCSPTRSSTTRISSPPRSATAVMLQTAALETAPTNPAMQQLVTDVRAVAPGLTDRPRRSSPGTGLGRPLHRGGEARRKEPHASRAVEEGEQGLHLPGAEHRRTHEVPCRAQRTHTVRLARAQRRLRLRRAGALHVREGREGQP